MKDLAKGLKQNKGFSLIELLVAIAIVALMTVPLLQSFIVSGRASGNARRLQNAQAAAQTVIEKAKRVEKVEDIKTLFSCGEPVKDGADSTYTLNVNGADGENFIVELTLSPTDHKYSPTEFADVFGNSSVIYSELIAYDDGILNHLMNTKIPYDVSGLPTLLPEYGVTLEIPKFYKLGDDGVTWTDYTPTDLDKHIRETYGNLLADEISTDDNSYYSKFLKKNIDKTVYVTIEHKVDGTSGTFDVTVWPVYTFDFSEGEGILYESVVESSDPAILPTTASFKCVGKMVFAPSEPIKVSGLSDIKPIYMLYAKSNTDPVTNAADSRAFKKESYVIDIKGEAMGFFDASGKQKHFNFYLVSQGEGNGYGYSFKINNNITDSTIYTNEAFGRIDIIGISKVKYDGVAGNVDSVGYTKKKDDTGIVISITSLYKLTAVVKHRGETIYSVVLED